MGNVDIFQSENGRKAAESRALEILFSRQGLKTHSTGAGYRFLYSLTGWESCK